MAIPSKPTYTHGAQGTEPSASIDYANGDPVESEEFDYFINTEFSKIKGIIDALNALDSDNDEVVDAADGAATWSDGDVTQITHPTDVNFGPNLSVTDDGDGTVTIDTAALSEEEVEDAVNALISAGTGMTSTYDDANDTLTLDVDSSFVQSEAITAINNDSDHGSTAQHNYFSGSHDDLTSVSEQDHHGEPVTFETGHTSWGDGLSDEEIHRIVLQTGETFEVERIEFRQKGGGSSTNADVDVFDETALASVGSATLGSTTKNPGSSGTGNVVTIRLTNSTGAAVDATVRVTGYINGA